MTTKTKKTTKKKTTKNDDILVNVENLKMYFPVTSGVIMQRVVGQVKAVDNVSFFVKKGETLGLVGESGCGKTTTGRAVLQLYKPTSGKVQFNGQELTELNANEMRAMRKEVQIIFQDPYGSLNPRMSAGDIIGEPLKVHKLVSNKKEYQEKVAELLSVVGLSPYMADRYPHEFSGGQRQRISIARAIATQPDLLILDEPVSALDVSIQAQILNLLRKLQIDLGIAYLFISHDLSIVRNISDRVAVMYLGKIVEISESNNIFNSPRHPYTKALLSAVPEPDPELEKNKEIIILKGELPSNIDRPNGCFFQTRCPNPSKQCSEGKIQMGLVEVTPGHWVDKCCMNCL